MDTARSVTAFPDRQTLVDAFPEFLANLEEGDAFFLDRHDIACPRVTSRSGCPFAGKKCSEASQFDPVSPRKRCTDLVKDRMDDTFYIAGKEMRVRDRQFGDEFGSGHDNCST
ncbi:hypothetical protein AD929_04505 [Gluconobacter potus]|uniref:Uncharacterized protein n=1 Tax=Gluconobacter potus TaxID=2724927 RepID=A0A149QXA3_9PROT|nr:hypothetical protein AD929_04505 [Gluconobacter potus]